MSLAVVLARLLQSAPAEVTLTDRGVPITGSVPVTRWAVDGSGQRLSCRVSFGPFPDAVSFDAARLMVAGEGEDIRFGDRVHLAAGMVFDYDATVRVG